METSGHEEVLRRQFAIQARHYAATMKFRPSENVVPMIELAAPKSSDRVLDVACGMGFVALRFAPHARAVLGVDLTPEMVDLAKKFAAEKKVPNVEYLVGNAEDLKFPDASFEIVSCRFSFHHFGNPEKALREMKRVLAPGGRIALYDFLANADPAKAKFHNEIESSRDPSHVRVCTVDEFRGFFRACGLEEHGRVVTMVKQEFEAWMALVVAGEETKAKTRRLFERAALGDRAGLGVRVRDGKITFSHTAVCRLLMPRG